MFKDMASGAIFVHAMEKCDTEAFIMAYTRFAARFCHPMKLFLDEGSQLLKACKEMEISWVDVSKDLNWDTMSGSSLRPAPWVATTTTGRSSAASGRLKSSSTPSTAVSRWT